MSDLSALTVTFFNLRDEQVPVLMALFKYWQMLGELGSSRRTSLYSDGDGTFRPRVVFAGPAVAEGALRMAETKALKSDGEWHADTDDCLSFYRGDAT